jgi:ANTAR domain
MDTRRPQAGAGHVPNQDPITVTDPVAEGTISERIAAVRSELAANAERLSQTRGRLQATRQTLARGRSQRQQLHDLVFARLLAQLETMPTIEQAKGILIAQTGCGPDQAFGMLREASQRSNVRVSDLAAMIVQRTVTGRQPPRPGPASRTSRPRPASPDPAPGPGHAEPRPSPG